MSRGSLVVLLSLIAVAAAFCIAADDSSAEICSDLKVYVMNSEGEYDISHIDNVSSVKEMVTRAMEDQGKEMVLNARGNISSIGGLGGDDGRYWRIYQWLPLGTNGWGIQTFNSDSDSMMASGATYCLQLSSISAVDGSVVYSEPDFRPVSTGYVFIRFANGFLPDVEEMQVAFTEEIRREGFWLEGRGSTLGEVVMDAVESNGFDISMFSGSSGGNDLSCWIDRMFGLGDVSLGDNTWSYWSQWTWVNHEWYYNDWTLGYYDPAVYRYVECIYLISTPDPYNDGYEIDKGGEEPNPDLEEPVCIRNYHTAEFRVNGEKWYEQSVWYGRTADMTSVPVPPDTGTEIFAGWGDTTVPITEDTVFDAVFIEKIPGKCTVTYLLHDGATVFSIESVAYGEAAVFDGRPSRPGDERYDYVFRDWGADLSSIEEDISVTATYDLIPKMYTVSFFDYDRTFLFTRETEYGSPIADIPVGPGREPTVRYTFEFASWSITPNGNSPADLSDVTRNIYVFAFYQPVARPYSVSFYDGDVLIDTRTIGYGSNIGNTIPCDLFRGQYIAKMYRDKTLTEEYRTDYMIIGDTNIYVSKVPGSYDSERDRDGRIVSNSISVAYNSDNISNIVVSEGRALICDISQFGSGSSVSINKESLSLIRDTYGDMTVIMKVPEGSLSMSVGGLLKVIGDEDDLTFSISKGPTNIRITSALKKLNYERFLSVSIKHGRTSVTDLLDLGVTAEISLKTDLPDTVSPMIWSVSAKGSVKTVDCVRVGDCIVFNTDNVQFFAEGTSDSEIKIEKQTVIVPYGEYSVTKSGSSQEDGDPDTEDYNATLNSIALDNLGGVLFVPSSFEGYPLKTISFGALNSVSNAPAVVIPSTVSMFYWDNWSNTGITDIFFLGDCPMFSDTVPSSVTVHRSPDASGWEGKDAVDDLIFRTYNGSYGKNVFEFVYYVVDGSIVVHRYVSGEHVRIPDAISVDGTERPVRYVGDAAFMYTDNPFLGSLYGLRYTDYNLRDAEIPQSVTDIHTRAFFGSSVHEIIGNAPIVRYWDECFRDCRSLSNVIIPDTAVFVGNWSFRGCVSKTFTLVSLPENLTVIGSGAFYGCSELVSVKLGSLTSIPEDCFRNCPVLCDIMFPDTVRTIGNGAFYNCNGLQYIDLNKIEHVGQNAFFTSSQNRLEYIVLGSSLKTLGSGAFGNCVSLKEMEVYCSMPQNLADAFANVDLDDVKIYASEDAAASWEGYDVTVMQDTDAEVVRKNYSLYVTAGMIVFFIILGLVSLRFRTKIN